MRVLAAMSGGVDSSVAAALLVEEGHEVVGVTMKLWDAPVDSGCCSVAEIDDARRVAHRLGIDHLVFNFLDQFEHRVIGPYAAAHAGGLTPNPCIECNRHVKFGQLLRRASQLGFDAVATGHHARLTGPPDDPGTTFRLWRGADRAKDQSYVLYVLTQDQLSRCLFPVGRMTKADVRALALELGLPTAAKPDSQDVCFVSGAGGRSAFLRSRIALHPGLVVDGSGHVVGDVPAVELVTIGQRRALGLRGGAGEKRYAVAVDASARRVVTGTAADLLTDRVELRQPTWVAGEAPSGDRELEAQCSAHGETVGARFDGRAVWFTDRRPRVAPGQSVVLYDGDEVIGGGVAA